MFLLEAAYDLTDYTAVRAVCIILTLILAGIVLAVAITNFIREGKSITAAEDSLSADADRAEPAVEETRADAEPAERAPSPDDGAELVMSEDETVEPVAEAGAEIAEPAAEVAAATTPECGILPSFFGKMTARMTEENKAVFAELIAGESRVEKTRLKYPLTEYADEAAFLKDFFLSSAKFKTLMPTAAMETLYKRRRRQVSTVAEITRLNNKMIAFYFARRKTDEDALDKCVALCKKDVAFNYGNRDVRGMKLPSLKRLILIYTAQKRYADAIKLCDEAITREVIEKKDEGYEDRRSRIAGKMKRAAEAAAKAAKAQAGTAESVR